MNVQHAFTPSVLPLLLPLAPPTPVLALPLLPSATQDQLNNAAFVVYMVETVQSRIEVYISDEFLGKKLELQQQRQAVATRLAAASSREVAVQAREVAVQAREVAIQASEQIAEARQKAVEVREKAAEARETEASKLKSIDDVLANIKGQFDSQTETVSAQSGELGKCQAITDGLQTAETALQATVKVLTGKTGDGVLRDLLQGQKDAEEKMVEYQGAHAAEWDTVKKGYKDLFDKTTTLENDQVSARENMDKVVEFVAKGEEAFATITSTTQSLGDGRKEDRQELDKVVQFIERTDKELEHLHRLPGALDDMKLTLEGLPVEVSVADDIRDLRSLIGDLPTTLNIETGVGAKVDDLGTSIAALEDAITATTNAVNAVTSEGIGGRVDTLGTSITTLTEAITATTNAVNAVTDEGIGEKVNGLMTWFDNELRPVKSSIADMKMSIEALPIDLNADDGPNPLQESVNGLKVSIDDLVTAVTAVTHEGIGAKVDGFKTSLDTELPAFKQTIDAVQKPLETVGEKLEGLKASLNRELLSVKNAIVDMNMSIGGPALELRTDEEIGALQESINGIKEPLATVGEKVDGLKTSFDKELPAVKDAVTAVQNPLDAVVEKVDGLKRSFDRDLPAVKDAVSKMPIETGVGEKVDALAGVFDESKSTLNTLSDKVPDSITLAELVKESVKGIIAVEIGSLSNKIEEIWTVAESEAIQRLQNEVATKEKLCRQYQSDKQAAESRATEHGGEVERLKLEVAALEEDQAENRAASAGKKRPRTPDDQVTPPEHDAKRARSEETVIPDVTKVIDRLHAFPLAEGTHGYTDTVVLIGSLIRLIKDDVGWERAKFFFETGECDETVCLHAICRRPMLDGKCCCQELFPDADGAWGKDFGCLEVMRSKDGVVYLSVKMDA